jgi:hypothetical protein
MRASEHAKVAGPECPAGPFRPAKGKQTVTDEFCEKLPEDVKKRLAADLGLMILKGNILYYTAKDPEYPPGPGLGDTSACGKAP